MDPERQDLIQKAEAFIQMEFSGEGSGHDHWHIFRVRNNAMIIDQKEGGDPFVVEMAALLHDLGDWKFHSGDESKGEGRVIEKLQEWETPPEDIERVLKAIRTVSFKGAKVKDDPETLEGKIVQDADRLDAMGAIGIARTFAFGGSKGRPIHIPDSSPELHQSFESYRKSAGPTIDHFYEKLLLLKERMKTETGKKMARERHEFMESFLQQFFREWGRMDIDPGSRK